MILRIAFVWLILCLLGCDRAPTVYQWQLPEGFPKPRVPDYNPMSDAKVALGEKLFFDKQLSFNQRQACASCHQPQHGFAEPIAHSIGSTGEPLSRNAMALVNVAYNTHQTWAHNGLVDIEQQIMIPLFSEQPVEMGVTGHEDEILARFQSADYLALFESAFGEEQASLLHINYALASFVRQLISFDSAFDRYAYQQQDDALTDSQKRGLNLFFSERTECHHCHGGFNLSQSSVHENQDARRSQFHNTGLYNIDGQGAYPPQDSGLHLVTHKPTHMGAFKAPTLRNIGFTAPYMHDGSITTLAEVVSFYNQGGRAIKSGEYKGDGRLNPFKSPFVKPLNLTDEEQTDLVNFLLSLNDHSFVSRYNNIE